MALVRLCLDELSLRVELGLGGVGELPVVGILIVANRDIVGSSRARSGMMSMVFWPSYNGISVQRSIRPGCPWTMEIGEG